MNIFSTSALSGEKILKILSRTEVTLTSTDGIEAQNELLMIKQEMEEAKLIYEMMSETSSRLELDHSKLCDE